MRPVLPSVLALAIGCRLFAGFDSGAPDTECSVGHRVWQIGPTADRPGIAGAEVCFANAPTVCATTDASGSFDLDCTGVDASLIEVTHPDHRPTLFQTGTGAGTAEIGLIPLALVESLAATYGFADASAPTAVIAFTDDAGLALAGVQVVLEGVEEAAVRYADALNLPDWDLDGTGPTGIAVIGDAPTGIATLAVTPADGGACAGETGWPSLADDNRFSLHMERETLTLLVLRCETVIRSGG